MVKRVKISFLFWLHLTLIFIVIQSGCIPYISKRERINLVRVAIVTGIDSVIVSGKAGNKFFKDKVVLPKDTLPMYLMPIEDRVVVNGKPYRGSIEIKKLNKKLWVINIVNVEDYLMGVIPCEIGRITPDLVEAAKAQAIAARTYAYAHLNQYSDMGFDLYSTIIDQVYEGIKVEDELINQAIKKTKGLVLTYNGNPIEAKYHSTCGGRTADFSDAWSGTGPAYLRSVVCKYCIQSPYYQWQKRMHKRDFFKNLRKRMQRIGINILEGELIKGFRLKKNSRSQRINEITIITNKNEYVIANYNIRTILGTEQDPGGLLRSNYFTISTQGDSVIISGKGYGHGVGMCQFGAIGMAKQKKNYKEILKLYYPGTRLERIKN